MNANALRLVLLGSLTLVLACAAAPLEEADEAGDALSARRPPSANAHLLAAVEKVELARLDAVVGKFVSGKAIVYRGTFEARDNTGAVDSADGIIAHGEASGSLSFDEADQAGAFLKVVRTLDRQQVNFVQTDPGVTRVSTVLEPSTTGGLLGSCTGCLLDLTSKPTTFSFSGLKADGFFFDMAGTPFHITASGAFTALSPASLTFDDVTVLERELSGFRLVGAHRHRVVRDHYYERRDGSRCELMTGYEVDWRINRADLTDRSLASARLTGAEACCRISDSHQGGGIACAPVDASRSVSTGVGARATVRLDTSYDASTGQVSRHVAVDYVDVGSYFGASPTLKAVIVANTRGQGGTSTHTHRIELARTGDVYTGLLSLGEDPIVSVELAFSNAGGAKWDSNDSRNYTVVLPTRMSFFPPG